jgi:hypothetical protein
MANNPSHVTVTINPNNPQGQVQCSPDIVAVAKQPEDGVQWTISNPNYVFTGVTIDGVMITPPSDPNHPSSSGDFSGVAIDNSDNKSVMTVDDSLAEITGDVHSEDHSYTVNYADRNGSGTYAFDPTIRNQR